MDNDGTDRQRVPLLRNGIRRDSGVPPFRRAIIPAVDFGPAASERLGLAAVLLLSGLGLLAGMGSLFSHTGSRWMTVATARYAKDFPRSRLPQLPRGIFLGLLFSAFPLLKGWCYAFLSDHAYFIIVYVCCGVSTGMWLLIAFLLQPLQGEGTLPPWLRVWNWANAGAFVILMVSVVKTLTMLPAQS